MGVGEPIHDGPARADADYAGASALITGGLGFLGSNLARRLLSAGAEVAIIDNLTPEHGGAWRNVEGLEKRLSIRVADARDLSLMRALVRGRDVLFNLVGQSAHLDSMRDPFADLECNCRAPLTALEAARAENPSVRVVFASTRQIYGRPAYLPVDEAHPLHPVDVNGIHKLAGEWHHLLYDRVHGLSCRILRLTNAYGPRMRVKDARQTFLGAWIRKLLRGEPFEVWGGDQLRDFTYVDDALDALLLAGRGERAAGRIFNLGGAEVVSLRDLARLLVDVHGGGTWIEKAFPPERQAIDIGDYYADYRAIQQSLGWSPSVRLRDGLRQTLDFFRENLADYE